MPLRLQGVLHRFAGSKNRGVEFIVLADFHGAVAPVRRSDQPKFPALLGLAEVFLIVSGLESLFFREHPDLVQMNRFRFRRVEFAVRHAGARAHVLHVARLDHRAVAHTVFMFQGAFEDVRDDFHVAVRVLRKAAAPCDAVVVHYAQRAELRVLGIEVIGEGKSEMRIQPAVVGVAAFFALENVNHCPPPGFFRLYNTRYNDYCQEVYLRAFLLASSFDPAPVPTL